MKSPFPGMDPFIEARGLWRDFHQKLVSEIERDLAARLPGRYAVRLDERTYVDWIAPDDESRVINLVQPDVRVDWSSERPEAAPAGRASAAVAEPPLKMHTRLKVTEREAILNVVDLQQGERLVTCLELLSPSNKRRGSDGWKAYERKREKMLRGAANFIEIDLLRRGTRRPMRERWPADPYYILVSRQTAVPECDVWPAHSLRPLPVFAVPLLPDDADLQLSLQPLCDDIFQRSKYYWQMRYGQPHRLRLLDSESQLLADHLQQQSHPQ